MNDVHDIALAISSEAPGDAVEAMALVDRVFGPGRLAKAAERLREGNRFIPDLSFTAREEGRLVGTVRLWPVRIGDRPALLLGPIAVDPDARNRGLGATLVERACDAARKGGHAVIVLVGDVAYFERLGFVHAPDGPVIMPGPADPSRILVRGLEPGALDGVGGEVRLP